MPLQGADPRASPTCRRAHERRTPERRAASQADRGQPACTPARPALRVRNAITSSEGANVGQQGAEPRESTSILEMTPNGVIFQHARVAQSERNPPASASRRQRAKRLVPSGKQASSRAHYSPCRPQTATSRRHHLRSVTAARTAANVSACRASGRFRAMRARCASCTRSALHSRGRDTSVGTLGEGEQG